MRLCEAPLGTYLNTSTMTLHSRSVPPVPLAFSPAHNLDGYYRYIRFMPFVMQYKKEDNNNRKKADQGMFGRLSRERLNVFVQQLSVHKLSKGILLTVVWFLGVTIFDITEPINVRYCFVDFYGMQSKRPVQLMTPLTARIYSRHTTMTHRVKMPLLDGFNGWDTILVTTLQNTWPHGECEEPGSDCALDVDGRIR